MKITDYEELAREVDSQGSVVTVDMGTLRDVHGAGKLGSTVVSGIHDKLEGLGLGHLPAELPTYQDQRAIIYRKGTAIARIIEAVRSVNDQSAAVLREIAQKDNRAETTLQRIREMVCD